MASPSAKLQALPSRNPIPLSAAQESQVVELYHKRVRAKCADEIRGRYSSLSTSPKITTELLLDFAACAMNRTFTAAWRCRDVRLAMNSCMVVHATPDEQDAAREEWFATRGKQAQEREEKARKRAEQEKVHREWWGLPPKEAEEAGTKG